MSLALHGSTGADSWHLTTVCAWLKPSSPPPPPRSDFCRIGNANPRDAEDLVQEACKAGGVVPNTTTLRTLDRIWAAHEQLHG